MCERVFVCVWVCVYRKRALFKIRRTARRHIAYIVVVVVVAATKKFSIVPSYFFPVHTLHANLKTIAIFICFRVFFFDLLHDSIVLLPFVVWMFDDPYRSNFHTFHTFFFSDIVLFLLFFCFHLMLLWFILILNDVVGFVLSFLLNYVCGCVCGFLFFVIEF